MQADFDIEPCRWCNGDGKDHASLGQPVVRDCPRCAGSGRVYVTNRESATGRRRVYKGPAPRPGADDINRQILAPAKSRPTGTLEVQVSQEEGNLPLSAFQAQHPAPPGSPGPASCRPAHCDRSSPLAVATLTEAVQAAKPKPTRSKSARSHAA